MYYNEGLRKSRDISISYCFVTAFPKSSYRARSWTDLISFTYFFSTMRILFMNSIDEKNKSPVTLNNFTSNHQWTPWSLQQQEECLKPSENKVLICYKYFFPPFLPEGKDLAGLLNHSAGLISPKSNPINETSPGMTWSTIEANCDDSGLKWFQTNTEKLSFQNHCCIF